MDIYYPVANIYTESKELLLTPLEGLGLEEHFGPFFPSLFILPSREGVSYLRSW